jgi:hypothetical protein
MTTLVDAEAVPPPLDVAETVSEYVPACLPVGSKVPSADGGAPLPDAIGVT